MSATKIEWCDTTWNPVTGCSPVSSGCTHCFARRMSKRLAGRFGYPKDDPFKVTLHPDKLDDPLHWRKPRRVFVCSMGDLFHEDVHSRILYRVFNVMLSAPRHTYLILTKRPERMRDFFQAQYNTWVQSPPKHLWLGVSVENQKTADERIPLLLQTPAAVRFVSYEPALGPVDLDGPRIDDLHALGCGGPCDCAPKLDWVICGGETGPAARPMHPEWARSARDQCQEAGVPFFFKGWGEWAHQSQIEQEHGPDGLNAAASHYEPHSWMSNIGWSYRVGKKLAGRKLDGKLHEEYPE